MGVIVARHMTWTVRRTWNALFLHPVFIREQNSGVGSCVAMSRELPIIVE